MATTLIPSEFREFLKLLEVHGVRSLLIGGYAINAFGYVRSAANIDVWIASDSGNQERVIRAIRAFGCTETSSIILSEPDSMLRIGLPPLRIQVLKSLSGVQFEDCWLRRVHFNAEGLTVPMISLDDLILNKRAAGRKKDLADQDGLP